MKKMITVTDEPNEYVTKTQPPTESDSAHAVSNSSDTVGKTDSARSRDDLNHYFDPLAGAEFSTEAMAEIDASGVLEKHPIDTENDDWIQPHTDPKKVRVA